MTPYDPRLPARPLGGGIYSRKNREKWVNMHENQGYLMAVLLTTKTNTKYIKQQAKYPWPSMTPYDPTQIHR
jgi:hypothetical protein